MASNFIGNIQADTISASGLSTLANIKISSDAGISRLSENIMPINMASGVVIHTITGTGTTHATSADTLTAIIKAGTYSTAQVSSDVNGFTKSADSYCLEIVGYYYAPVAGLYNFSTDSDDSSDLYIDGSRVAYWYGGHGAISSYTGGTLGSGGGTVQTPGSIYLDKGFHSLSARLQEGSGGDSIALWHQIPSGSWEIIPASYFYHSGENLLHSKAGGVNVVGSLTASGDITAYSDARLKSDIVTIEGALDKVSALRGVDYIKDGKPSTGVIAQEVEAVMPEVVHTADDEMGTKSVAYGNMVGVLIEAVKELKDEVAALKAEIAELKK